MLLFRTGWFGCCIRLTVCIDDRRQQAAVVFANNGFPLSAVITIAHIDFRAPVGLAASFRVIATARFIFTAADDFNLFGI